MLGITACGPRVDEKLKFPVDAKYIKWVGKPATGVKFTAIDGPVVDLADSTGVQISGLTGAGNDASTLVRRKNCVQCHVAGEATETTAKNA